MMQLPIDVHAEIPLPVLTQEQIDSDERVPDGTLAFKGQHRPILVWLQRSPHHDPNLYGTHYISHRFDRGPHEMFWGGGSGWVFRLTEMRPPRSASELLLVEAFRTWYAWQDARDLAELAESRHARARSALSLLTELEVGEAS